MSAEIPVDHDAVVEAAKLHGKAVFVIAATYQEAYSRGEKRPPTRRRTFRSGGWLEYVPHGTMRYRTNGRKADIVFVTSEAAAMSMSDEDYGWCDTILRDCNSRVVTEQLGRSREVRCE
jgi:hypothetical protein